MTKSSTALWLNLVIGFLALSGVGGAIFFFSHEPNNPGFIEYPNITLLHVIPGAIYLSFAPFQFLKKIRSKWIGYHRWAGRILLSIGLLLGIAALFLGLVVPYSGLSEQLIIGVFGTFFLVSLIKGFGHIRAGQMELHREWMIRAFAIGLSIATMRLIFIPALIIVGNPSIEQAQLFSIVSFSLAFILHCSFAEYWIHHTRKKSLLDSATTA